MCIQTSCCVVARGGDYLIQESDLDLCAVPRYTCSSIGPYVADVQRQLIAAGCPPVVDPLFNGVVLAACPITQLSDVDFSITGKLLFCSSPSVFHIKE